MKATKNNYRKLCIGLTIMLIISTMAFVIVVIKSNPLQDNTQDNIVGRWNHNTGFYCIKISNRTTKEIYDQFDKTINTLEYYSTQIKQTERE